MYLHFTGFLSHPEEKADYSNCHSDKVWAEKWREKRCGVWNRHSLLCSRVAGFSGLFLYWEDINRKRLMGIKMMWLTSCFRSEPANNKLVTNQKRYLKIFPEIKISHGCPPQLLYTVRTTSLSSFHFLHPLNLIQNLKGAWAYLRCYWTRGGIHPGQVASPSQGLKSPPLLNYNH